MGLRAFVRLSGLRRLLPGTLRAMEENLPDVPAANRRRPLPEVTPPNPESPPRGRVAVLTGCVMPQLFGDINRKTVPPRDEAKDRRRERRSMSQAELDRLLAVAEARDAELTGRGYTRRRVVYLVAAWTGLRRSELARLQWRDIDLDEGTLRVRAENAKS